MIWRWYSVAVVIVVIETVMGFDHVLAEVLCV